MTEPHTDEWTPAAVGSATWFDDAAIVWSGAGDPPLLLDAAGITLLSRLDGDSSLAEVVARLAAESGVDPEQIGAAASAYIPAFDSARLLDPPGPTPQAPLVLPDPPSP